MVCRVAEFWGCSMLLSSRRIGFTMVFARWLWVASTQRYYLVSSIFMGLSIGVKRFLGQNLLCDKIINKKMSYNQSLTLFKGIECNDCLNSDYFNYNLPSKTVSAVETGCFLFLFLSPTHCHLLFNTYRVPPLK